MKHHFSISVLLSGALWGIIGLFVRALDGVGLDSMQIVFVRSFFSMAVLFFGLLILKRERLKIKWKDIWCFLGTGGFSITFFNFCYFFTITETSLSVASVLLYTAPVFVAVMSSFLFGEKMTSKHIVCLLLALLGCVLVTEVLFDMPTLSPLGILVGFGAGFGYALYSIFGRYALDRGYQSITITFWTFLVSSVVLLPFVRPMQLFNGMTDVDFPWGAVALLVILSTVLPYLLYTYGLSGMEGGRASVLATVEPVVATMVGMLVYHEKMTVWSILGMLLVLSAVLWLNMPNLHSNRKK